MKNPKPYIDDDGEVRELDAHFFQTARRGRPPLPEDQRKQRVHIMLDPDVIEYFKQAGGKGDKGWQTRLNAALRQAAGLG